MPPPLGGMVFEWGHSKQSHRAGVGAFLQVFLKSRLGAVPLHRHGPMVLGSRQYQGLCQVSRQVMDNFTVFRLQYTGMATLG